MTDYLAMVERLRRCDERYGARECATIYVEAAAALEQAHAELEIAQSKLSDPIYTECCALREAAERRVEEAERVLREIVRRYDDYRGKGVMPTAGEYQMVVGGIEAARAFLATGKKEGSNG